MLPILNMWMMVVHVWYSRALFCESVGARTERARTFISTSSSTVLRYRESIYCHPRFGTNDTFEPKIPSYRQIIILVYQYELPYIFEYIRYRRGRSRRSGTALASLLQRNVLSQLLSRMSTRTCTSTSHLLCCLLDILL